VIWHAAESSAADQGGAVLSAGQYCTGHIWQHSHFLIPPSILFTTNTMNLCVICSGIDFQALIVACLKDCQHRQAADSQDYDEVLAPPQKHHNDIFEIQASAQACGLCKLIFRAFEERNVANVEDARDISIIFRSRGNKVEVRYDAPEQYIKLCDLDWYMNESDGE
jgi:hypothetical protein